MRLVGPGSPLFDAARASLAIDGTIGALTLYLQPLAIQTLSDAGLYLYYQITQVLAGHQMGAFAPKRDAAHYIS